MKIKGKQGLNYYTECPAVDIQQGKMFSLSIKDHPLSLTNKLKETKRPPQIKMKTCKLFIELYSARANITLRESLVKTAGKRSTVSNNQIVNTIRFTLRKEKFTSLVNFAKGRTFKFIESKNHESEQDIPYTKLIHHQAYSSIS